MERLYQGDQLCVPEFCLLECANVLWKQVRFRGVSQTEVEQLIVELLALPFELMPVSSLLPRALQIGLIHQLAVYDSLYIALAQRLTCPLITVDERQATAATASNVVLKPIGLVETGEGSPNAPEMELTPAAARRLMNRRS